MIKADHHVHTTYSIDADRCATPEIVVERAVAIGLDEIAITDHLDFKYKTLEPEPKIDLLAYTKHMEQLRAIYAGKIKVVFGLEVGPHAENAAQINGLLKNTADFDFIICSTHDIKGLGTWDDDIFFRGKTKQAAHEEYFIEIIKVIDAFSHFSVYGHLDYLDRYATKLYGDSIMYYADHADMVDIILKKLIAGGKGLEINTSGIRGGQGCFFPKIEYLKRYKELGGEIITVGSDAHSPSNIGANFAEAREYLLDAGFKYTTRFDGMIPQFIPLN